MKGPENTAPKSIPEEELVSATPSLIDAMIPSEPENTITEEISSDALETAEPDTLERPARRQALLPKTESEAETNRLVRKREQALHQALNGLEQDLQKADGLSQKEVSWNVAAPLIHQLNLRGKSLESALTEITETIRDASKEEAGPLRDQQRALREGIERLVEKRDELLTRIPQESTEEETGPYQSEKDTLARIRRKINAKELTPRMRMQQADTLRQRAQQIEQQPITNNEEQIEREAILEKIYGTIKNLEPEKPLGLSQKRTAETRLHQQLEEAAERVRETYGQRPEEMGDQTTFSMTRSAANFLRGLMNQPDPLEEWEELKERVRQQEESRGNVAQEKPASVKKRKAA